MRPNHNYTNFVNALMENINELTDEIYESIIDGDYDSLNVSIRNLQSVLRNIQKLNEYEF